VVNFFSLFPSLPCITKNWKNIIVTPYFCKIWIAQLFSLALDSFIEQDLKMPFLFDFNHHLGWLILYVMACRIDAKKLEEWARAQTPSSLVDFSSREGEIEGTLKDIAERVASGNFSYSRFFAVGLFRLLELSNASEPTVLEKVGCWIPSLLQSM